MLALYLAILAAAWLIDAAESEIRNVHGSIAFIRTGERTPIIEGGRGKLSVLGARQMQELGQMFRGRYIGDETYTGLGQDSLIGLSQDILNPNQLFIQTLDSPYLQASAQAFMQGLYPPVSVGGNSTGPVGDETAILANDTVIQAPLGGYQYAPIQVLSEWDPQSIYISGNQNCPLSIRESLMYQTTDHYLETKARSEDLYQSLNASLFKNLLLQSDIDYFNSLQIYDYLHYEYLHNSTVQSTLSTDATMSGLFDQLRWYADETAWYFWGNTSTSSSDNDIRAMAGRTLAALVLGQFQKIWTNAGSSQNGNSQPLTLLFGDHEPIISLISLLMLDTRFPGFQSMPPQASAIVFELFSVEKDGTGFPSDPEKLWINFHFQNGTDFQGELTSYPIFGRGLSETDMPWLEFENMMSRIMTNEVLDWCTQCSSAALFCWGVDDVTEWSEAEGAGHGGGGKGGKVSPAVGGVIGAVVALVAAGLIFAAAMLLGGIRFRRVERGRRKSSLGGFKGSQKLASDADLSLPKNGAAPAGAADTTAGVVVGSNTNNKHTHERVGSWELRQKEFGPPSPTGHPAAEAESPRASFEAIEAAMARAVLPAERV